MGKVTQQGYERVAAKIPASMHGQLRKAANIADSRTAPDTSPAGEMQMHRETVTLDDIPDGHAKFDQVMADARQVRASAASVGGGYRDTPYSREFWGDE